MYEDRKTATRCNDWMDPGPDLLRRTRYRCEFKAGHKGLHYAEGYHLENAEPMLSSEPRRWGTEDELREEMVHQSGQKLGQVTVQKLVM